MSVFVEKGGDKIPAVVGCVGWKFGGGEELGALENQVAEVLELAGFPWGDSAVSDGGGEFGEKAVDFRSGTRAPEGEASSPVRSEGRRIRCGAQGTRCAALTRQTAARKKKSGRSGPFGFAQGRRDDKLGKGRKARGWGKRPYKNENGQISPVFLLFSSDQRNSS